MAIPFEENADVIHIQIAGVTYDDLVITENADDAQIQIAGHETVTVKDTDSSNLGEEDFVFL